MKTLESVYSEIVESGMISKSNLQLLKNRANREQKNLLDYNTRFQLGFEFGIPLTEEQGLQALNWLKKFIRKDGSSDIYGNEAIDCIMNASPSDFVLRAFYEAGRENNRYYMPIYHLGEMEYIPMKEPSIVG